MNPTSSSIVTNDSNNNNVNCDQIQWPTLYSTIENMSLKERHHQKQSKSHPISSSVSMQDYKSYNEQQRQQQIRSTSSASIHQENNALRSHGHGRTRYDPQNSTNNHFYRQTSVTPQVLNSPYAENQNSTQSSSTYYGSGSNVGRGRPMTGER